MERTEKDMVRDDGGVREGRPADDRRRDGDHRALRNVVRLRL